MARSMLGQEDCLVVNVYTPKLKSPTSQDLLPVLVFIHGGAFYFWSGTNDFFGPERFMDYEVVKDFFVFWSRVNKKTFPIIINKLINLSNLYQICSQSNLNDTMVLIVPHTAT